MEKIVDFFWHFEHSKQKIKPTFNVEENYDIIFLLTHKIINEK